MDKITGIGKFIKKPVIIEAVQWQGDNYNQIVNFMLATSKDIAGLSGDLLYIKTLENKDGEQVAQRGDWIIRGIKGEYYPCKPDIFKLTYNEIKEERDG